MDEIEIGLNIVAKIYLHLEDSDMTMPFEISNIEDVIQNENNTTIRYREPSYLGICDFIVKEDKSDIDYTIDKAKHYKEISVNLIKSHIDY